MTNGKTREFDGSAQREDRPKRPKSIRSIRVICFAILLAALIAPTLRLQGWAWLRQEAPVSAWTMLFAAKRSGMIPTAFYASGTVVTPNDGASRLEAARRVLKGVPNAQAEQTVSEGVACLTVSVVCTPDPWAAAEALHRIQSALGIGTRITLCLVGRGEPTAEGSSESNTNEAQIFFGQAYEEAAIRLLRAMGDEPIREAASGANYASVSGAAVQTAVRATGEAYIGVPWIPLDY